MPHSTRDPVLEIVIVLPGLPLVKRYLSMASGSPHKGDGDQPDSRYAWQRLLIALGLATIGGIGLWSVVVTLPAIEAEFGVDRGGASVPFSATMIGLLLCSRMKQGDI